MRLGMGFDARPDLACLTTKDSMLKFELLCINNLGPKLYSSAVGVGGRGARRGPVR